MTRARAHSEATQGAMLLIYSVLQHSNSAALLLLKTANSGANGRKRALPVSNSANRTTKRTRTGKDIYFAYDFAYLCVATRPPPLVINEDPDHEPPSDSNIDDEDYRQQSKSPSSHMDEDGGTSEGEAGPEDNTDHNGSDAATVAPERCTLRRQFAVVSPCFGID
jgi:hypothetical protein